MTKKLFYEDPYLGSCEARVLRKEGSEIYIDQTVFFAFSGGQASDSGEIGGIAVKSAVVAGNDIIYTLEKEPSFRVGDTATVSIDMEKRLLLMRLHSAAHIVHFLFEKKTGVSKLIGSNVDIDKARLDYIYPESIAQILPGLEESTNSLLSQNYEIKCYGDSSLRKWSCSTPDGDIACNCSGTHVSNTREIGAVRLKRKNLGAGKERIEITFT